MNKKTSTRFLLGAVLLILIATVIAYFVLRGEKPWMAFFVACCGGVFVFNILISIFFINKNFKK